MSAAPCKIIVIGAGLVGERHAELVHKHPECELVAIVDPRPEMEDLAASLGCALVTDLQALDAQVDAVIVATPNHTHFSIGMQCAELGLPCLMEKPITDNLEEGRQLVEIFKAKIIPLLVGHHRRYHPFVAATKQLLASGEIGKPVCGSMIWAVKKPDSYFDAGAWRLGADGGPIMINLIHEMDMMRCLFGEVLEVSAISSNAQRETPVEDTSGIILRFESGFIATVILSDAALTPWSFEGACGENPNIAETGASSWRIGCTEGAFEFPLLRVWRHHEGQGDWSKSLVDQTIEVTKVTPLRAQLEHFVQLVRGTSNTPMVSGEDGLKSLEATRAVLHAAHTKTQVNLTAFTQCSQTAHSATTTRIRA